MQHYVHSIYTYARTWYAKITDNYSSYRYKLYRLLLLPHAHVLHIGRGTDELARVDFLSTYIFVDTQSLDTLAHKVEQQPYDYIIISLSFLPAVDIQALVTRIVPLCSPHTRIIIDRYVTYTDTVMRFFSVRAGVYPERMNQQLSWQNLQQCVRLAGLEIVAHDGGYIFPWAVPGISLFFNSFVGSVPGIKKLGYMQWLVARLVTRPVKKMNAEQAPSVSIIIPCKNEKGNIEPAVQRIGNFARTQEIIFVEGNSSDGTREKLYNIQRKYPEKNITVLVQQGRGKRDAVYQGFAHATGDILMILDADLTVMPEELGKFYITLCSGVGEFINGSRLIYPMDAQAMQQLNFIANHSFSKFFSWIFGQKITDTLCGTKVFYKKDLVRILQGKELLNNRDPFGDFDLLCGAARAQLKIVDMPVHYRARSYGTTQIRRFYHGIILIGLTMLMFKKFKMRP